jgi:hypothetical protein
MLEIEISASAKSPRTVPVLKLPLFMGASRVPSKPIVKISGADGPDPGGITVALAEGAVEANASTSAKSVPYDFAA